MRILKVALAASAAALLLAGCAHHGVANRGRPDEFSVVRNQPLVLPPDYALVPPKAGEPSPQAADPSKEALEALFGGPAPRSRGETTMIDAAERNYTAAEGARSVAGDPNTNVVDKGATTAAIVAAPATTGQQATVTTPQ
jgi:hypothetical protein